MKQKILIASDHAGFVLKEQLKEILKDVQFIDLGPTTADRCDYPDYAQALAKKVSTDSKARGILICGSGIGMSIAANRFPKVRAALVESLYTAQLSRLHNDANILCLGSRLLAPDYASLIATAWLKTEFEGGRHTQRLRKIDRPKFAKG